MDKLESERVMVIVGYDGQALGRQKYMSQCGTVFTDAPVSSPLVILSLTSTIHHIHVVKSITTDLHFGTSLFP
jgi:hypothetical protein